MLAIFATLFGSATSLGLGALQINSGLDFLWGVNPSNGVAIAIIAVLTVAFVLSAVSGVEKGVQWLSNGNMVLAIALLLFLVVVGPTVFEFETLTESIGGYLTTIVPGQLPHGRLRRQGVALQLDDLLLGVVDLVGTLRGHVHRAHLQGPHDPRVRRSACC